MQETTQIQDSIEAVVRDSTGRIKTTRYVSRKLGKVREFVPNKFYINLLNKGLTPYRIPLLMGKWIKREK